MVTTRVKATISKQLKTSTYESLFADLQIDRKIMVVWGNYFKGGFPVIAETTRSHIFSIEVNQVILAAIVLAPNLYCQNRLQVT